MRNAAALIEFAEWDPDNFFVEDEERVFIELKEGANYFGRDPWNHIVLKGDSVRQYAGILFLKEGRVFLRSAVGQEVTINNKFIDGDFIYSGEDAPMLQCGPHKFHVILHRGRIGIEFV